MNLLVVGARPKSLGEAVARAAKMQGFHVGTAGISGEEYHLDVARAGDCVAIMGETNWQHVVCTAGINKPASVTTVELDLQLVQHLLINCVGPMRLLYAWLAHWDDWGAGSSGFPQHFAVVSSNSARIARSMSAPYCASKAALSMAIRCAAREVAKEFGPENPYCIYGWEPGWIEDTPMSREAIINFNELPMHRIPGNKGISKEELALSIVNALGHGTGLNGCMIPFDGGEQ